MLLFRQPILLLLGADRQTMPYAFQYYFYIVLGAPFIILSYTPLNLLRTEGFASASMVGSVAGAVINILLDPFFISTLGLGAAGAAIATVIGNICTDLYFVWFLLRKSRYLSVDPRGLHISGGELISILAIGIPASVTNLMQSIGVALMNRFLLPYGNDKVATMGVVLKINLIAVMVMVGIAFGGQPLIGYTYGAHNKKRLREAMKFAYVLQASLALGLSLLVGIFAPMLVRAFLDDGSLVATGTQMLRVQQTSMVFVGFTMVTTCIFQSAGKAISAFWLSVTRQGVIFAIVITAASHIAGYKGVICSQALSDLLTAMLAVGLLWRWRRAEQ